MPREVGTIGFAAQVDGVVPVDATGNARRQAIIWMDRRAVEDCDSLERDVTRGRLFEITGLNLDAAHVAPKVLWIRRHEPEVFDAATHFLSPASFIVRALTDEVVCDDSNASSTMLYDIRRREWSQELMDASDLNPDLFGPIEQSWSVAGTPTKRAAESFGLDARTKVIVGCGDDHAACLGAGVTEPNLICDVVGTAEPICVSADGPVFDEERLVETHAHGHPNLWLIENPGFVAGGSVRWLSDTLGTSHDELNTKAAATRPGAEGLVFLPCLSGATTPTWNSRMRGAFIGLSLRHGPGHLARAVLEGCSFATRDVLDRFSAMGLGAGDVVRIVGGGARSRSWCQIKADISGRTLATIQEPETTAVGAAMLACIAEGTFVSLSEAAGELVQFGSTFDPNPGLAPIYEDAYEHYRSAYAATEPLFAKG